jgi:hypothetical protein
LHDRLRARLDAPELIVPLGFCHVGRSDEERERLFGPHRYPMEPAEDAFNARAADPRAFDDGLLIIDAVSDRQWPHLRPAAFADPDTFPRVERLCRDHGMDVLLRRIRQIKVLYDDGLARMVARASDTPVPPGGYEANPLLSVPDLVEEVDTALGAGQDAAALYLQLLTLSRPTDRNIRKWNGWTAPRHKAAQTRLVELGAVQQDKRPRAGRTAFLPGGWTQVKTPHPPLETYKLDSYLAAVNDKKEVEGPFTMLLPPIPLHEMFTNAWKGR